MSETPEKTAADLAADTLTGDVRDALLTHVRTMEDPWSKLSEKTQGEKIEAIEKMARWIVACAVKIVATEGFDRIEVKTGKFTVKDGVKLELQITDTVNNITKLAEHAGSAAVLVFADPANFHGARSEAKPDPDAPGLPLDESEDEEGDNSEFTPNPDEPEDQPEFPPIPPELDRREQPHA